MLKILKYDRIKAVNYALNYALKRNNIYYDYTNEGGNCTNYVSQCLFAGTNVMNFNSLGGWFYLSPSKTSVSWANVEPLYNFLIGNKNEGVFGIDAPLDLCEIGDVIQLRFKNKNVFSHCLFVTKVISTNTKQIFVCANTRDVKEVPLNFYSYEKYRLIHILGYRKNN